MSVHCGINLGHDAGVGFYDGCRLELWEFERLLGVKHACGGEPGTEAALRAVMGSRLDATEMTLSFSDYFTPSARMLPEIVREHGKTCQQSHNGTHWLGEDRVLEMPPTPISVVGHHYAHAASAFLTSPHESALILCLDGIGSDDNCGHLYIGEGQRIIPQLPFKAFYGPRFGLLYECASRSIFGSQFDTGKLMGLAAHGAVRPEWIDTLRLMIAGNAFRRRFSSLLDPVDPAAALPQLTLNGAAFPYSESHGDYFGAAIASGKLDVLEAYAGPWPQELGETPSTDPSGQLARDIAASVQHVFESELVRLTQGLRRVFPQRVLCYVGGCALNINANSRVLAEAGFDDVFIPSCCNDSGIALGAALASFHGQAQQRDSFDRPSATFAGPVFQGSVDDGLLASTPGITLMRFASKATLVDEVAMRLHRGQALGWVAGRMETGPRALGRRSLLASPLVPGMRRRVSEEIKGREWFRPVAPMVRLDDAARWFEGPTHKCEQMLFAVKSNRLDEVTHADGTARLQTVTDADADTSALLRRFGEVAGVPVLMNTSLNGRGKPIANDTASVLALLSTTSLHGVAVVDEAVLLTKAEPQS